MKTLTIQQSVNVCYDYPVVFTESVFNTDNAILAELIRLDGVESARVLVAIEEEVNKAHGDLGSRIMTYANVNQLDITPEMLIAAGGEKVKADQNLLEDIYRLVVDKKIDRHSYVLAIGGGAFLDAVGYAAATAHRGIRLIRMPSTVLSQNDAGIGVKNGINYRGRKNFLGTFAPPYAVINDLSLLRTLSDRDKRAGIAEAVKVALIKDKAFFKQLFENRMALAEFQATAMRNMIIRCAQLHLNHIRQSGDPFEMGSARPLDFGHWSAHVLEVISDYQIRHGEAVAVGIALDTLYCCRIGLISESDWRRIWQLLSCLGFDLRPAELAKIDVNASLEQFREHLGGPLSITVLTGIGSAKEVHRIDEKVMKSCIVSILKTSGTIKAGPKA